MKNNNNNNDDDVESPAGIDTHTTDRQVPKSGNDDKRKSNMKMILALSGSIIGIVILLVCLIEKKPDSCTAEDIRNAVFALSNSADDFKIGTPAYKALEWMLNDTACPHQKNFKQRYAMAAISFGLGYEEETISLMSGFKFWANHSRHECDWYSPYISCYYNDYVTSLSLYSSEALPNSGQLPTEIGLLHALEYLSLHLNGTNTIPTEVGTLRSLQTLSLDSYNWQKGAVTLPTEIGNLQSLSYLTLSGVLNGPLPTEVGQLTQLRTFTLQDNVNMSGTLPTEIGNWIRLASLKVLRFFDNQNLTGTIPTEVGSLSNLRDLEFFDNPLSGSLPSSIANPVYLNRISIQSEYLRGPIPSEIGNMKYLYTFYVAGSSSITGTIPTEISGCTSLGSLNLRDTALEGPLPTEIGRLSNLGILNLDSNQLTGTIPTEIAELRRLSSLYLSNNSFSGPIPDLTELTNLQTLHLEQNNLTGTVPCDSFEDMQWSTECGACTCCIGCQ